MLRGMILAGVYLSSVFAILYSLKMLRALTRPALYFLDLSQRPSGGLGKSEILSVGYAVKLFAL